MDDGMIALVLGIIVIGVVIGLVVAIGQRRAIAARGENLRALATAQGWQFTDKDKTFAKRWHGKPFTSGGSARHIISGSHWGREISMFEYHYTTTASTGTTTTTQNHVFSVWAVELEQRVPDLSVGPEGAFGGKVAEAFGFARVDTGDTEFDEMFKVKCDDEAFGRAVLAPEVVALLKRTGVWHWRLNGSTMLSFERGALDPEQALVRLEQMSEVLDLVPAEAWRTGTERGRS